MVYFRLIIASFKYCQEKFLTKIFLGKVCKSIDWPCVSPVQSMFLGNKRNFGREILFQITIFLSEIHNLQAMLKCQDQHLMNSKWLGGIFSERTVRHWGSGKVTAIILHSSIINQSSFIFQSSTNHHSFINQSSIQRAARNLCVSRYDIFCKPYFWPNAPNPILVEGPRQVLGPTCTRVQWL